MVNTYKGFFFCFVLCTVILVYLNEFINKIMKWNIGNIKNYSYEAFNRCDISSWKPVLFLFLLQECHFLYFTPWKWFFWKFWTINADLNEEFTIKHWEKVLCGVCGRHCGNLNLKCFSDETLWNIFRISEKKLVRSWNHF